MIPIINHVYACNWDVYDVDDPTYFNLITYIDSTTIYGICIDCSEPAFISKDIIKWHYSAWDHKTSQVVDLGHINDLPELFI